MNTSYKVEHYSAGEWTEVNRTLDTADEAYEETLKYENARVSEVKETIIYEIKNGVLHSLIA